MGTDIIKGENRAYAKYEEVLLRRDNLKRAAEKYHLAFIREFGDLITRAFQCKIACIRKKKMIAYCQRLANRGMEIDRNALNAYIEREMLDYQIELDDMLEGVRAAKGAKAFLPADGKKLKTLYYALAKLIHPDLHPELAGDEVLKEYWQRIVVAYTYNCLDDMVELDLLVRRYLADHGIEAAESEIKDIDAKIAAVEKQIDEIISTNPFLYRLILSDPKEIREKKREYEDEIASYQKYEAQLDEVLRTFEIREMLS